MATNHWRILSATAFLLLPTVTFGEPQGSIDLTRISWRTGNSATYTYKHRVDKHIKGEKTSSNTLDGKLDINVIAQEANDVVVRWALGKLTTAGLDPKHSAEFAEMMTPVTTPLEIAISNEGSIVEIRNWEKVRDIYRQFTERYMDKLAASRGATNKEGANQAAKNAMAQMVATEPAVRQLLGRDAGIYFSVYGAKFEIGNPLKANMNMPFVLGPGSIPCKVQVVLESIDTERHLARLRYTQDIDADKALPVLMQWAGNFAAQAGAKFPSKDDIKGLAASATMHTEAVISIDTQGAWIQKLNWTSSNSFAGGEQIDELQLIRN